jgi:futalosine hydrolase
MYILIAAATPFEIAPLNAWLEEHFQSKKDGVFSKGELSVQLVITGVGVTATAFHLGWLMAKQKPDWVINAGIAGTFSNELSLGSVVQVVQERFGDLGVEEADGRFTDLAEMGLWPHAILSNPNPPLPGLPQCNGLTVNKVHGYQESINQVRSKYPEADIESMEGAAVFYACLAASVPFVEIRSVSNMVEPRNRDAWNLPLAIQNLNQVLIEMLDAIPQ